MVSNIWDENKELIIVLAVTALVVLLFAGTRLGSTSSDEIRDSDFGRMEERRINESVATERAKQECERWNDIYKGKPGERDAKPGESWDCSQYDR